MEIMKKLYKHELNFDYALKYFEGELNEVNALSNSLLKIEELKNGKFFTLLPDNANLDKIHDFKIGGILPQLPIEKQIINGKISLFSWISDINKELAELILKKVNSSDNLICVFDDVSGNTPIDKNHPCFSDNYSVFYEDEVYYIIKENNISFNLICDCFRASTSFWHSLAIITKANINTFNKFLTKEIINEVCLKTELIMVGAYDGEGYVFWEKTQQNGSKGVFE